MLAIAPVPDIPDGAFEKKELARVQKEQTAFLDALQKIRYDSTALQQQLDDQLRAGSALNDQVNNLRHNNETLRTRLYPDFTSGSGGSDGGDGADRTRTRALERQSAQLNDELRFAEVDCNLSRADARQIVYTAKQRKELLTDALKALNELATSPDEDVQRKARQRLLTLRSIASTVHD
jgi:chromosome segregation ATPase